MKTIKKIYPYFLIILGLAPLVYWIVSAQIMQGKRVSAMSVYTDNAIISEDTKDKWKDIEAFNKSKTMADYDKIPSTIGWVSIDEIDINYPIHKYATEESLEDGVAHLESTDIPTDDKCDTIIMGHNGTIGEAFFTNLNKLSKGSLVETKILNKSYIYEVVETETVLPEQIHGYTSEASTLTLITCTPYGTNTHRLLIHCIRKEV